MAVRRWVRIPATTGADLDLDGHVQLRSDFFDPLEGGAPVPPRGGLERPEHQPRLSGVRGTCIRPRRALPPPQRHGAVPHLHRQAGHAAHRRGRHHLHGSPASTERVRRWASRSALAAALIYHVSNRVGIRLDARGWFTFTEGGAAVFCSGGCVIAFGGSGFGQIDVTAGLQLAF